MEPAHSYAVIIPWSLFTAPAWNTAQKKVLQHHIFFPFCHTVAKFCLQQAQKRRGDPQGPIVSVHPRSTALSAAVKAIFSSSRMWDLFVKSLYAYCDGGARVKIKGSPDQTRSFLSPETTILKSRNDLKKAYFSSLTCSIKIEKQMYKPRK